MKGYILKRILHSIVSIVIVVLIVMLMVFQFMDRNKIFGSSDPNMAKLPDNQKVEYKYSKWEKYGYLDYVTYGEYITDLAKQQNVSNSQLYNLPDKEIDDSTSQTVLDFKQLYENKGYKILRLDKIKANDSPVLLAYKDYNVFYRLWNFFANMIVIDNTNYVKLSDEFIAEYGDIERKIEFCMDPINGWPCIMGYGTKNRYLLYFDSTFPFIHQNFITLNFGIRYSDDKDFFEYFTAKQGEDKLVKQKYPESQEEVETAVNLHERRFKYTELTDLEVERYGTDRYVLADETYKTGMSMLSYSFVIGIIATILVYCLGVPLGVLLSLHKDKWPDKLGNLYIIFIMAVPSLAYIYLFYMIGNRVFNLPVIWGLGSNPPWLIYIMPIISLALPAIASIMKWVRRYMIDQMSADYVKFARAQGYSEGEIFRKHILKNALIPISQGIPASIIGCLTGAIITEKVYGVPGMGKLLTEAINSTDNSSIIAITFIYAVLSVVALFIGDIVMAKVDPRISFTTGGGRK